jgi:hypothetical protein
MSSSSESTLHSYRGDEVELKFYGNALTLSVPEERLRPETAAVTRFGELTFWYDLDRESAAAVVAQLWLVSTGARHLPEVTRSVEIGHETWTLSLRPIPEGLLIGAEQRYAEPPIRLRAVMGLEQCAVVLAEMLVLIATSV